MFQYEKISITILNQGVLAFVCIEKWMQRKESGCKNRPIPNWPLATYSNKKGGE